MKCFISIALMCFVFGGCKVLSKSQAKAVSTFADGMTGLAAAPVAVKTTLDAWKYENDRLDIAVVSNRGDFKATYAEGLRIYKLKLFNDSITAQMDTAWRTLEKCGQALLLLTDEAYLKAYGGKIDTLMVPMDTAISVFDKIGGKTLPTGLGDLAAKVLKAAGEYHIKRLQYKYLRDAVNIIAPALDTMYLDYQSIFRVKKEMIARLEVDRIATDRTYYNYKDKEELRTGNNSPITNFWYQENLLLPGISRKILLEDLMAKTDTAMLKMKNGIDTLQKKMSSKTSGKEMLDVAKDFLSSVQAVTVAWVKADDERKKNKKDKQ